MPAVERPSRLRTMAGKPLTLIIGWVLSCALVTGVTLTAVGRVGHEISGNQPQVITEQQVLRNLTATPTPATSPASSTPAATTKSPSASTPSIKPVVTPPSKSASPSVSASDHPKPTPTPTETPKSQSPPPPTRPTTPPATSHPATSSPASSPAATAPVSSPATSPSPTPSPGPTASVPTGKYFENVNGGEIIIACSGDTVSQASAVLSQGSKYTFVLKSTSPKVDAVFTAPDGTSTEYVFTCAAGQVIGGTVTPEHTS